MTLPLLVALSLVAAVPSPPSVAVLPAASRIEWTSPGLSKPSSPYRLPGGALPLQIAFGAVAGGVVGFAGLWGSVLVGGITPVPLIVGSLGVALGAPLGVWLGSSLSGFEGSVPTSFQFALLGTVPAIVMSLIPPLQQGFGFGVTYVLAGLLPLAGAVVGHRWSEDSGWMATYVPRPDGGSFAIVGRL